MNSNEEYITSDNGVDKRIYQYSLRIASQALAEKDIEKLNKMSIAMSLLSIASNIEDNSLSERLIRASDKLSNI